MRKKAIENAWQLFHKNDGGLVRKVTTGLSWTGFFFTGFTMMARGMISKGLVYLVIVYSIQCTMLLAQGFIYLQDGAKAAATAGLVYNLILIIPNFVFLFKLNKWTARHWLDRGYKPVGNGWSTWGSKVGLDISDEQKVSDMGLKPQSKFRVRDIIGFIAVAIVLAPSGKTSSRSMPRISDTEEQTSGNTSSRSMPRGTETEEQTSGNTSSTSIEATPDAIVGYWKSIKKNDVTDEHLYIVFTEDEFLDLWEMKPYKITNAKGSKLMFAWSQDVGPVGEFSRKSVIEVYPNGNIRLQYDSFSDGFTYQRLPKKQWETEVAEQNASELQTLRSKLQEFTDKFAPSIE